MTETPQLPRATSKRWQPLRCGLVNLFKYDDEEFLFEEGNLLWRGNNGAGKSRAMALQLPFLLDGEISPHRLEPDGDKHKRMSWNLLMDEHDDRQGYTWLELGRLDDDGEHYLTLGCGLKATKGRREVERWFFITPQRVGRDLFLVGKSRCTLGRRFLEDALGDEGKLFLRARDYRHAIDAELFGLGTHRYEALINLLIQLRKPQLSRTLDEERLSSALSEALAPLSEEILADVAEAFRELESDRSDLERYQQACQSVQTFLGDYRRYVQIAARRRSQQVCGAHSDVEATAKTLRSGERKQEGARRECSESHTHIQELETDEHKAEQRAQTLRDSPEMKGAHQLAQVKQRAAELREQADHAEREAQAAKGREAERREELEQTERAAGARREELAGCADEAMGAARPIGLEVCHEQAVAPLSLPDPETLGPLAAARSASEQALNERQGQAEHLRRLDERAREAQLALGAAKTLQERIQEGLDDAVESQQRAANARKQAADLLVQSFLAWIRELEVLSLPEVETLVEELEDWAGEPAGASPAQAATQEARDRQGDALSRQRVQLEANLAVLEARRAELLSEQEELTQGRHCPPAAPPCRDPDERLEAPGAPLWRVVDFHDDTDEETRAGVEAALEAAGLLDAWIAPDGRLRVAEDGTWARDAVVAVGRSPLPPEASALASVLRADIDPQDARAALLDADTVNAVLAHVGYGADVGSVWVAPDGRYQVGLLHGAWTKDRAEHIGEGARQARRRSRLAELAEALVALNQELRSLTARVADLERRRATLNAEALALPSGDDVRQAAATLEAARVRVAEARQKVTDQEAEVLSCRQALERAKADRLEQASDLGLREYIERANELERALALYGRCQAALWPAIKSRVEASQRAERARHAAEAARGDAEGTARHARKTESRAAKAREQARTLEATVGASAREIQEAYERACRRREELRELLGVARERNGKARETLARAEATVEGLQAELARLEAARADAVAALQRFGESSLLDVALGDEVPAGPPPSEWSCAQAIRVAHAVELALGAVAAADDTWKRAHREIHQRLQELTQAMLPHGYQPTSTLEAEVLVVVVPFQGAPISVAELERSLAEEVDARRELLTQRERKVIEDHLIGDVASHLHDRLHEAERLVADMNTELERCPTSAGMELRFRWEPVTEGPTGLGEARKRLMALGATWSAGDREALGAFLQERIESVRIDVQRGDVTGTWHELLRRALDYRDWHRFTIERRQGGGWRRLTRRTHGTGSGGEKAIALTIPQLAAAAAHYRSAKPEAPRFILLDEAFVGVDADMRAKCMGLLTAFDLDLVMTSEREWGCYATLPGIAICQLATAPNVDAIHVTRWVWNGRSRERDLRAPVGASAPSAPTPVKEDPRQLSLLPDEN